MRLLVLGAAAGGGYPQWNCLCETCRLFWEGDERVRPSSQSSIAVTADGEHWLLLNASPDLRQQIMHLRPMRPSETGAASRGARRASPIASVLITNGDVDHTAGLLTLREKQDFTLYATGGVHDIIAANPVFQVLDPNHVPKEKVAVGEPFEAAPGLVAELFSVPGKVPLYLETETVDVGEESEMTVGVKLTAHGRTIYYIPGCAHVPDRLRARVAGADALLFDGTVFVDEEMKNAGVGVKTGRRMGHMPISDEGGSLHAFDDANIARRIYIHINNTNPILVDGSDEKRIVEAAGWQVAYDGMDLSL
ncbi:pyrroloquinoline quinone biosynthesis protein PqqB [Fulvimarina sp. 2208YS6-2-32]|uniref:Coenzyme PQQ synthesis protein B n=1 Tax=Fulvimarina uroteuthidis TaxID=3098149 RepID=A0ABU5HX82_9HYPH|nr:pyrroloquinoline quinone biosynthesis protein PqqB [Fulvimarina sp. 2208YS6-2-32]MDY8107745.1 pyrroloquinoline quinone biosynthesis protein PqqB [Fulvimarina sp. 2208YS6-2-32]